MLKIMIWFNSPHLPFTSNFSFTVFPLFPLSFDTNFIVDNVDISGTGPGMYCVLLKKKMFRGTLTLCSGNEGEIIL